MSSLRTARHSAFARRPISPPSSRCHRALTAQLLRSGGGLSAGDAEGSRPISWKSGGKNGCPTPTGCFLTGFRLGSAACSTGRAPLWTVEEARFPCSAASGYSLPKWKPFRVESCAARSDGESGFGIHVEVCFDVQSFFQHVCISCLGHGYGAELSEVLG